MGSPDRMVVQSTDVVANQNNGENWENQSFHSAGDPARGSGAPPFGTEIIEVDPDNLSGSLQLAYDVILDFERSGAMPSDWSKATSMTEPCKSDVYCKMDNGELKAATIIEDVPCTVDVVTHLLLIERMNWDTNFIQYYIAERATSTMGPPIDVLYCRCKSPFPMLVSDRDYVQLRLVAPLEDGGVAVICLPTARACLPELPDAVRTDTLCSGYVVRPSKRKPNHTDIWFCTHTKVGNVPGVAVQWGAGQGYGQFVQRIVAACAVGSTALSRATYESVKNGKGVPLKKSRIGNATSEGSEGSFHTVYSQGEYPDGVVYAQEGCCRYGYASCHSDMESICTIM